MGEVSAAMRGELRRWGIEHLLEVTGFLSHEESLRSIASASVLLAAGPARGHGAAGEGWLQAKLFEYLATGLPILWVGSAPNDGASLLARHAGCRMLGPDNADTVVETLYQEVGKRYRREARGTRLAGSRTGSGKPAGFPAYPPAETRGARGPQWSTVRALEASQAQERDRAKAHVGHLDGLTERIIVPTRRRLRARDLLQDASVIRVLAARDFKVKYKQSALGPLWLLFQPLALLAAFLIAFRGLGNVQTSGIPYAVFTLVGLSAWSFFQAAMTIGTASVITNVAFVRFTPCPRPAFPLAAIIASLPSFFVTAAGALIAAAVTGHLSPRAVLLPAGLAWLLLLTAGVVGIAASLAVRYRDIISALPFVLQLGLFITPIGYSLAGLSAPVRLLVDLNPLTGLIEAWRWMVLSGYYPSLPSIVISLVATPLIAAGGWLIFSRLETTMADDI